jgi:predicted GIY-YIG superfamily endonuclease
MSQTQALYRFFDQNGNLLYVGITSNPGRRWTQHATDKPWWHEVHHVEIERHESRQAVLLAEQLAIKNERPRYNVVHQQPEPAVVIHGEAPPGKAPCEECGAEAECLYVLYRDLWNYDHEYGEWDQRVIDQQPSGMPKGSRLMDLEQLLQMPEEVRWHASCDEHQPDDAGVYAIDYPRSWRAWVHDTAHLMGKGWFGNTDWESWLFRLSEDRTKETAR